MERVKCEDCSFFAYEDTDGRGEYASYTDFSTIKKNKCEFKIEEE